MVRLATRLLSMILTTGFVFAEPSSEPKWKEVWRDDFSGTRFNESDWCRIPQGKDEWNRHMSTREDLVEVKDGNLILWGKKNDDTKSDPRPYLTGGIWTMGKRKFVLGKIEIRAKFEDQQGAWPAFWTYGYSDPGKDTNWPHTGEIDIIERLNSETFVHQTVHSAWTHIEKHKSDPPQCSTAPFKPGEYNVYGVEVREDAVVWSVNGKETFRYPRVKDAPTQWPFKNPQKLLLDMQLGGEWVGAVDVTTLPVAVYVDWVRFLEADNISSDNNHKIK